MAYRWHEPSLGNCGILRPNLRFVFGGVVLPITGMQCWDSFADCHCPVCVCLCAKHPPQLLSTSNISCSTRSSSSEYPNPVVVVVVVVNSITFFVAMMPPTLSFSVARECVDVLLLFYYLPLCPFCLIASTDLFPASTLVRLFLSLKHSPGNQSNGSSSINAVI